jgi:hypothetical protein
MTDLWTYIRVHQFSIINRRSSEERTIYALKKKRNNGEEDHFAIGSKNRLRSPSNQAKEKVRKEERGFYAAYRRKMSAKHLLCRLLFILENADPARAARLTRTEVESDSNLGRGNVPPTPYIIIRIFHCP